MKFLSIFLKISPFIYKNHLFVSPIKLNSDFIIKDPDYEIKISPDYSIYTEDELRNIDTNKLCLDTVSKFGDLVCFVIWQGHPVHRSIIQTKGMAKMEGDRKAFYLNYNEVYIHSCFTTKDHRGKGLYTAVLNQILTTYTEEIHPLKVFIACRQKNSSSIKGIKRAGFNYLKSSIILGILSGRIRVRFWYKSKV